MLCFGGMSRWCRTDNIQCFFSTSSSCRAFGSAAALQTSLSLSSIALGLAAAMRLTSSCIVLRSWFPSYSFSCSAKANVSSINSSTLGSSGFEILSHSSGGFQASGLFGPKTCDDTRGFERRADLGPGTRLTATSAPSNAAGSFLERLATGSLY